jgi:hypothetical protein
LVKFDVAIGAICKIYVAVSQRVIKTAGAVGVEMAATPLSIRPQAWCVIERWGRTVRVGAWKFGKYTVSSEQINALG